MWDWMWGLRTDILKVGGVREGCVLRTEVGEKVGARLERGQWGGEEGHDCPRGAAGCERRVSMHHKGTWYDIKGRSLCPKLPRSAMQLGMFALGCTTRP